MSKASKLARKQQQIQPKRRRPWMKFMLVAGLLLTVFGGYVVHHFQTRFQPPAIPIPNATRNEREFLEVMEESRKAILVDRRSAEAWGRYGMVLRAYEFDDEADIALEVAHRLDPSDGRWPYYLGRNMFEKDPIKAADWLAKANQCEWKKPEDKSSAEIAYVEALIIAGKIEDAATLLENSKSSDLRVRLAMGKVALARGELREASRLLEPLKNHPNASRQVALLLAQIAREEGRIPDALTIGNQAAIMARDTRWPDPLLDALVPLNQSRPGRLDESVRLIRLGQYDDAAKILEPLVREQDPKAMLGLSEVRRLQGRMEESVRMLKELVLLEPDGLDARYQLAIFYFSQGEKAWNLNQREKATEWFDLSYIETDRLLKVHPEHGKTLLLKGITLYRFQNKPREGIEILSQFVKLRPEVGEGHFHLGLAYVENRQFEDAKNSLERAAQMAVPGDLRAAESLKNLHKR
jgi:tetratricopeptide (TPR) repeat protein